MNERTSTTSTRADKYSARWALWMDSIRMVLPIPPATRDLTISRRDSITMFSDDLIGKACEIVKCKPSLSWQTHAKLRLVEGFRVGALWPLKAIMILLAPEPEQNNPLTILWYSEPYRIELGRSKVIARLPLENRQHFLPVPAFVDR